MNFKEAIEYSLTVPWKVQECFSGPECWCRMIVPVEPIPCEYVNSDGSVLKDTLDEIVGAIAIDKITAEYIVRLHNDKLEKDRTISHSMIKILQDKPLDQDYGISQ
jgi:hypothetical protein